MITTNTGAKKIEGTDNWRQIFDDHNDSVDAHDKTQSDLDYIINGNSSTVSIVAGKFVSVRGSTITGVTDGIYTAAKAIPASTTLDSSYFTAVTGGALNALSDQIGTKSISTGITGMTAYKSGNVVTLECEWTNDPVSVSAGGYVELGTLPATLRPAGSWEIAAGMALAGGTYQRKTGILAVSTTGIVTLESSEAMSFIYASATYVTAS